MFEPRPPSLTRLTDVVRIARLSLVLFLFKVLRFCLFCLLLMTLKQKRKITKVTVQHSTVFAYLVYVTAFDELICRSIIRDCVESKLYKAMLRSFVRMK